MVDGSRTVHRKLIEIDKNGHHNISDFEEQTVPYCLPCGKTFNYIYDLDRHVILLHSTQSQRVPHEQSNVEQLTASNHNDSTTVNTFLDKSCEAGKCSKTTLEQTFQSKFKVKHIDNHSNHALTNVAVLLRDTTCSYCRQYFSCEKDLKSHIETKHAGDDIETDIALNTGTKVLKAINKDELTCKMCDFAFCEFRVYQQHCRTVHSKKVKVDKHGQQIFADLTKATISCGKKMSSDKSVDKLIKRNSAHKNSIKRTQAALTAEDNRDEEDVLPYCIQCRKTFTSIRSLKSHLKSSIHQQTVLLSNNSKVDLSRRRCQLCNTIYTRSEQLRKHFRKFHRDYFEKNKLELFPKEDNTYGTIPTCDICEKEFDKYYNLKKHTLTVHNQSFDMKCLYCNKAFISIARLKKHTHYHLRKTHDQQKRADEIKCRMCNKISSSSVKHDEHISIIHHGTVLCTCSICKIAIRKTALKRHMKRHRNESRLKCSVCKMRLRNHFELLRHKENHIDKDNPFKCNVCFKTFTNQSKLKMHMYVHSANYIPLHCKMCDRKFYDQRILDKHMKKHAKGDPIICSYCGKQFIQDKNLQVHIIQKHLNEKPYVCEVCGKAFELPLTLKRHALVHTREKAFQCPICYQKFSQQASVKRHMVVHSGAKPYKCKHCDKRYSQTTYLQVHIKNHHASLWL